MEVITFIYIEYVWLPYKSLHINSSLSLIVHFVDIGVIMKFLLSMVPMKCVPFIFITGSTNILRIKKSIKCKKRQMTPIFLCLLSANENLSFQLTQKKNPCDLQNCYFE